MKYKALLLTLLAVTACEPISYNAETRLVLENTVKDNAQQPLFGVELALLVSVNGQSEPVSHGSTDNNGHLTLAFPDTDSSFPLFTLTVHDATHTYRDKTYINIPRSFFENYTAAIETQLDKVTDVVQLNLLFNNVSGKNLSDLELIAIKAESTIDFSSEPVSQLITQFDLYKNQTAILQYTVTDFVTNISETYSEIIQIQDQDSAYTLTY